jgi:hypothetical protein
VAEAIEDGPARGIAEGVEKTINGRVFLLQATPRS